MRNFDEFAKQHNLELRRDDNYVLLKCGREPDWSDPAQVECRGHIWDEETGELVCRPYSKFFNWGEDAAAPIDWSNATVMEKADGSLIKFFYHNNEWHMATNGSPNAAKTYVGNSTLTFYDLFCRTLRVPLSQLLSAMDKNWTYLFELCAHENALVVHYKEPTIYALGRIETKTGQEDINVWLPGTKPVERYECHTLEQAIGLANSFSNMEGFVVWDGKNRIKVKSANYLAAARAFNNGKISSVNILTMIREGRTDDLIGAFPHYKPLVEKVKKQYKELLRAHDNAWDTLMEQSYENKKEFAIAVMEQFQHYAGYLFARYDGRVENAATYFSNIPEKRIAQNWFGVEEEDPST